MVHGRRVVIDAKGHIVGRLSAYTAKLLREGYSVVLLRAEGTIFSSPLDRMVSIYKDKKRKRCLVNPKKGPFHFKEPSKALKRVVRGMLNYKGSKGAEDYNRLKVFDGIPVDYEVVERVVIPRALAESKLNPVTKRCTMGEVCESMGWTNRGILEKFEKERIKRVEEVEKEKAKEQKKKEDFLSTDGFKKEVESILASIE